jgi:hypothetical protein
MTICDACRQPNGPFDKYLILMSPANVPVDGITPLELCPVCAGRLKTAIEGAIRRTMGLPEVAAAALPANSATVEPHGRPNEQPGSGQSS